MLFRAKCVSTSRKATCLHRRHAARLGAPHRCHAARLRAPHRCHAARLGGATYSLDEVGTAEEDDDDDNDDDEHSGDDRRSRCKQQDPPGACRQCVCATGINGGGDGVSADHVGCLGCLLAWGVCLNVVRTDVWSVAQDLFRLHLVASTPSPCFSTPVAEFRIVFLYDYRQEYEY